MMSEWLIGVAVASKHKLIGGISGLELVRGNLSNIPARHTVVEVLADTGIEIPTSCEQGTCGACLTPVLQGTQDHRDLVQTEEEHTNNDQMTLCCARALTEMLVLDL